MESIYEYGSQSYVHADFKPTGQLMIFGHKVKGISC